MDIYNANVKQIALMLFDKLYYCNDKSYILPSAPNPPYVRHKVT